MLKGKYVLLSLAAALVCWQAAGIGTANSGIVDPCKSLVSAANNTGTVLVCPLGDGDPLNAAVAPVSGTVDATITLTVKDNANVGIAGIPATDCWLVGCNDGLLLCGGSTGSNADAATDASGVTHYTNEPIASGCDTGLYAVVQGVIIQDSGTCQPKCLAIAAHSPDYKGGPACPGDNRCPDAQVTLPDFSWFTTHYPVGANPKPYFACADYAAPIAAPLGLPDFSKFSVHYAGAGHKCPI
jgi:hypothetical protein